MRCGLVGGQCAGCDGEREQGQREARRRSIAILEGASLSPRRREERSDEAIHSILAAKHGLLRFARNDGGGPLSGLTSVYPFSVRSKNLRDADLQPASPRRCSPVACRCSRSIVSRSVLRQMSTRAPCATRLSTSLRFGLSGLQQLDARAEGDDLDRDLVGVVVLHQIVGDADDEALLLRIVVGQLQHDLVLGERLVLQRRQLGAASGAVSANSRHGRMLRSARARVIRAS